MHGWSEGRGMRVPSLVEELLPAQQIRHQAAPGAEGVVRVRARAAQGFGGSRHSPVCRSPSSPPLRASAAGAIWCRTMRSSSPRGCGRRLTSEPQCQTGSALSLGPGDAAGDELAQQRNLRLARELCRRCRDFGPCCVRHHPLPPEARGGRRDGPTTARRPARPACLLRHHDL
jgi:hypothetical protein